MLSQTEIDRLEVNYTKFALDTLDNSLAYLQEKCLDENKSVQAMYLGGLRLTLYRMGIDDFKISEDMRAVKLEFVIREMRERHEKCTKMMIKGENSGR